MRTTLNLDPDVAEQLIDRARREGRSLSRVVNDLVRAGFLAQRARAAVRPYQPPVVDTGRALVDVTDVTEALEQLDRD